LRGEKQELTGNSAIYVATLGSSEQPRRVSAGEGSAEYAEHDIAWSPDSKKLAFLSDRESSGQLELHVADAPGHTARRLTSLTGFLASPSWSPDGKTLALLFTENAPRAAGPLEPMTPPSGLTEQQVYEQRLTTVEVASGQVRQVSPADLYIHEYDWSPDGRRFVATAAHGAGDANWWIAQLCTIAIIGGIMSDEGSNGGDIYTIPASGGEARHLTPGIEASPATLIWLPSSEKILFAEQIDGSSGIATVDARDGKIETLWSGPETISTGTWWDFGISLAEDGKTCALVRQSFQQPPEIWAGEIGAWKQVTRHNAGVHPRWGK